MRRIEVDDEVYAELERHVKGFEQPNDVLRRLLLKDTAPPRGTAGNQSLVRGRLWPLVEFGSIKPGDELRHNQPRKGRTFTARVDENGWIVTDHGPFKEPSPALAKLVGTQIDGWAHWTHVPSEKSLRLLRHEMRATED